MEQENLLLSYKLREFLLKSSGLLFNSNSNLLEERDRIINNIRSADIDHIEHLSECNKLRLIDEIDIFLRKLNAIHWRGHQEILSKKATEICSSADSTRCQKLKKVGKQFAELKKEVEMNLLNA